MKKIKTTVQQRQLGKKCNCFYRGEIHACQVIGFSRNHSYTICRLEDTEKEVNVRSSRVNWDNDPKIEEAWIETHEARQDRMNRLRETQESMQQAVKKRIRENHLSAKRGNISKRRQQMDSKILKALSNRLKSLCGAGSQAVSQMLNVLHRHGDKQATLLLTALNVEKENLRCYWYDSSDTRIFNWENRMKFFYELMEQCKKENIPCGYPKDSKEVVCVLLPGCETLSFPVKQWLIGTDFYPEFPHPYDGKPLMNLRKLESAVTEKYGWYLRIKYPERFPA